MQQPEAVQRMRNRQAEIDFHLCRLQWFLSQAEVAGATPLKSKIDRYQSEWDGYQERIAGDLPRATKARQHKRNKVHHAA